MKVGELAFVLLIACGVLASVWLLSVDSAALPLRPPAQPKRAQLRPQPIPSNFNFPLSSHTANAVASSPSSTSSTTSSVTTTKTPGTPARGQRVDQVSARLDLALETADASLGNATLGSRPVPTQLLVLGMHHSGTSLLAVCLERVFFFSFIVFIMNLLLFLPLIVDCDDLSALSSVCAVVEWIHVVYRLFCFCSLILYFIFDFI